MPLSYSELLRMGPQHQLTAQCYSREPLKSLNNDLRLGQIEAGVAKRDMKRSKKKNFLMRLFQRAVHKVIDEKKCIKGIEQDVHDVKHHNKHTKDPTRRVLGGDEVHHWGWVEKKDLGRAFESTPWHHQAERKYAEEYFKILRREV